MPTPVSVLLASTWPITPSTAPSLRSVTVVAGSFKSMVVLCSAVSTAGGSASTSTLRPTDNAVVGLTEVRMTSCMRNVSVQNVSSPYVSNRKMVLPDAIKAGLSRATAADGLNIGWRGCRPLALASNKADTGDQQRERFNEHSYILPYSVVAASPRRERRRPLRTARAQSPRSGR